MLIDVRSKGPPDKRNVAKDGSLILGFLYVFTHQPAEHHRLPIINADARGHLTRAEYRLVDNIRGELNRLGGRNSTHGTRTYGVYWTPVIDDALDLDDLRNQAPYDGGV